MIKYGTGKFEQKVSSDKLETNDLYTVHDMCDRMVELDIPQYDAAVLLLNEVECVEREIDNVYVEARTKVHELKIKKSRLLSNH